MASIAKRVFLEWLSLLFLFAFWSNTAHAAAVERADSAVDLKALLTSPDRKWSKETVISFPSSPEFTQATERWTIFRPPTYRAAIRPGTVADIQKVVRDS
jgi:hypothetical protein